VTSSERLNRRNLVGATGGSRRGGVSRPDPEAAGWDSRPWAELAREVYDGLYEPAGRPSLRRIEADGQISIAHLSGFFSGRKPVSDQVFGALVGALGGDPGEWEWRWRAADAAHKAGAEGRALTPLPGLPAAAVAAPPEPVPEWPPPRYLPRRLARALLRSVMAVLCLPARRRRRDASEQVQARRMAQRVLGTAQEIIDRSEAVHRLPARFTVLTTPPAGRRRKELRCPPVPRPTAETDIRVLFDDSGEDLALVGRPGLGKSTQLARLARSLARDAIEDPSRPVPVLLDLTAYRGERLEDWLVTAIGGSYGKVPAALARTWLGKACLLPV
jgi:hypothetical protein